MKLKRLKGKISGSSDLLNNYTLVSSNIEKCIFMQPQSCSLVSVKCKDTLVMSIHVGVQRTKKENVLCPFDFRFNMTCTIFL